MARTRCGCSAGSCSCVVEGGNGIDVTGAGTVANPYVVELDSEFSLAGRLQVVDTDTVDLTLSGDGSLNNPWILRADTELAFGDLTDVDASNMTVGYVPARQADGTFAMVPAPTAPPGAIVADASIDGDGSIGAPLSVHDYDRIAWLSGADNLPNNGQLRMGLPTDPGDSAFWVARQHTGGSGGLAYDVQADHKISSIVGTDVTPDDNPMNGPYATAGLRLRVQDNNQQPDRYSNLTVFQDGRIARFNRWQDGIAIRQQASYIPYAMWSTVATATSDGGDSHTGTIMFPPQYFTDVTEISLTGNTRSANRPTGSYAVMFYNVTTSGASFRVRRVDGGITSGDLTISIQAIQMHPA